MKFGINGQPTESPIGLSNGQVGFAGDTSFVSTAHLANQIDDEDIETLVTVYYNLAFENHSF